MIAGSILMFACIRMLRKPRMDLFYGVTLTVCMLLQMAMYYFLHMAARPRFFDDGSLQHGGEDISQEGVLEYVHDVIYLTVVVLAGVGVTKWVVAFVAVAVIGYAIAGIVSGIGKGADDDDHMEEEQERFVGSRKERRREQRMLKNRKGR